MPDHLPAPRPRIGIARCLLGDEVRYDGRHKRAPWLFEGEGLDVDWIAVCPEIEVGMGVPREPIELVTDATSPLLRLRGVVTATDWTDRMVAWSRQRLDQLRALGLSGYVLKSRSPSCGLDDALVRIEGSAVRAEAGTAPGLFARELMTSADGLPVSDEERLRDPDARRAFFARVRGRPPR